MYDYEVVAACWTMSMILADNTEAFHRCAIARTIIAGSIQTKSGSSNRLEHVLLNSNPRN